MRILRHQRDKGFRAPVVALGNFDGLHQGHKAILARTIALAEETGTRIRGMRRIHMRPTNGISHILLRVAHFQDETVFLSV